MATRKTYSCDLCRNVFEPELLHGIYFVDKNGFEKRDSRTVEHHLCQSCLDSAARLAEEYSVMRPVSG